MGFSALQARVRPNKAVSRNIARVGERSSLIEESLAC